MKYISLFSGIESATVAWQTLGWEPVAYAEIEPFPKAVLKHHYPNVPDLGDMTKVNPDEEVYDFYDGMTTAYEHVINYCRHMLGYSGTMPSEVPNQSEDAKE